MYASNPCFLIKKTKTVQIKTHCRIKHSYNSWVRPICAILSSLSFTRAVITWVTHCGVLLSYRSNIVKVIRRAVLLLLILLIVYPFILSTSLSTSLSIYLSHTHTTMSPLLPYLSPSSLSSLAIHPPVLSAGSRV